jgi:CheY-like chemotaxis protein
MISLYQRLRDWQRNPIRDVRSFVRGNVLLARETARFDARASASEFCSRAEPRASAELITATQAWSAREAEARGTAREQDQAAAAEQLEELRQLAGELAHDFNNLLTIMLSIAELMLAGGELSASLARRARTLISATQRAALLTAMLLNVSRREGRPRSEISAHDFVHESLALVRRMVPELELRTQIAADTGVVRADTAQLAQVLASLVLHVRDSMQGEGTVGVCSERVELEGGLAGALEPGAYALVAVGAASELEASLADALRSLSSCTRAAAAQTPSETGRTSGLGLTSALGVVRAARGHLALRRGLGQTPLFMLYLPLLEPAREQNADGPEAQGAGQASTVLVAEDELLVRQLACALLREEGYQVLEASDGLGALELARRHVGPIDLLLTDVTMPHMGGVELAREMQRMFPALSVLYMSGHSEDTLLRQGLARREAHFLPKPFSGSVLAGTVRRMLQASTLRRELTPAPSSPR